VVATKYSKVQNTDLDFLAGIVGPENLSVEESELLIHAVDAYPSEPIKPEVVVWPATVDEIAKIIRYANDRKIPVTPRAAGSSLSGNVIPAYHGIVMSFRRMNKIIAVHEKDMQVVVQPGVVYDDLNAALVQYNLFFPPNPGSSTVCTIGGMVANNASGMGAVKYGVTRDYVLKLQIVLANGSIIHTGSNAAKSSTGYDLVRLIVGSEGTLAIITEITLKLKTLPQTMKAAVAYFDSVSSTTDSVSRIMRSGLSPAALEFMDHNTITAVNKYEKLGLEEAAAMLLIEFHGPEESVGREMDAALEICKRNGSTSVHFAKDENERKKLWEGRKGAYPSLLRLYPTVILGDIAVPISRITEMIEAVYGIASKHDLQMACFGHSGDGNLHPHIITDRSDKELWNRALEANREIVEYAIKLGGVASAEHGIGLEKKGFMKLEHGESLEVMKSIKKLLDPNNILNPGKFFDIP